MWIHQNCKIVCEQSCFRCQEFFIWLPTYTWLISRVLKHTKPRIRMGGCIPSIMISFPFICIFCNDYWLAALIATILDSYWHAVKNVGRMCAQRATQLKSTNLRNWSGQPGKPNVLKQYEPTLSARWHQNQASSTK